MSQIRKHRTTQAGTSVPRRLLALVGAMVLAPSLVQAQATWEYSPYRIHVWLACDTSPELTQRLADQIATTITDRGDAIAGATWDIRTRPCPEPLRSDVVTRLPELTVEDIQRVADRRLKIDDKLILLSLRAEASGFRIAARELDCHTRTWQPLIRRETGQPSRIPETAFSAVLDAFTPLVRIESVKSRDVAVRVRAGGLITDASSPAAIGSSDVLQPVIRRNDRLGEPMKEGILVAPWTFLTVEQLHGNTLDCKAHSGQYSVLGMRSSSRTQKFALVSKPPTDTTDLRVVTRGENPQPLAGYEIYSKDPVTEETELIGKTDWRGDLTVHRGDKPLQVLYVRNGGQLLARLPMVPGLEAQLTAEVRDDDRRLEAEGFIKGLQSTVMDLVARRELYISRFRRYLKAKEFDKAKELLEEFGKLQTRSDVARELLQARPRFASSDLKDRAEQAKIDKMFTDTQQLLTRFLDPGTGGELATELAQAQRAG